MKTLRIALLAVLTIVGASCGYGSKYNSMMGIGAAPSIVSFSPMNTIAGASGLTLVVTGGNFASGAVVYFNGMPENTTFISAMQVSATIPASAVSNSGMIPVYVRSNNQNSNTMNFPVN